MDENVFRTLLSPELYMILAVYPCFATVHFRLNLNCHKMQGGPKKLHIAIARHFSAKQINKQCQRYQIVQVKLRNSVQYVPAALLAAGRHIPDAN